MTRTALVSFLVILLTATLVATAGAQTTPPPIAPAAVFPPPAPVAASLRAGRTGFGVGASAMLFEGPSGAQVVYDQGAFHVEGLIGATDPLGKSDTRFGLGARFWYHLHAGSAADFSIGGGLGYRRLADLPADANDLMNIEGGVQLRAFVVSNVALSGTIGLSIVALDSKGFELGGSLLGGVGLTYYFF